MRARFMFIAAEASVSDQGELFATSTAGVLVCFTDRLPVRIPLVVCAQVLLDHDEVASMPVVTFEFLDPQGNEIGCADVLHGGPTHELAVTNVPVPIPWALRVPYDLDATQEGEYRVRMHNVDNPLEQSLWVHIPT